MSNRSLAIVAAIGALLFVVLFVVGFAIQPTGAPDSGDTPLKIATYAGNHRGVLLTGYFLFACSAMPFLLLLGALYRLMRNAEGPGGWLSITALASGVLSGAVFTVGTAMLATLAYRPLQAPVGILRTLLDAAFILLNIGGIAGGVFIAAVSASALLTRFIGSWVGWLGAPIAALQVVAGGALARGDGAFSPQGLIPLIAAVAFAAWMLLLALSLVLSARAGARPAAAPA
jgi:hypothetical protein